jgi:cytochrome b subunit of formate dehydrogenase
MDAAISGGRVVVRYYQRLSVNQRVQHIILLISFSTLVLTGIPVRYSTSPVSGAIIRLLGGMEARGIIHRVAAVALVLLALYHGAYTLFTREGRREFIALIPVPRDALDIWQQLKYYLGLSDTEPRYGRYNWIEKFEYLAVGWGTVVMAITGFMMWFPVKTMEYLPKWTMDVARVIHSYEALLAFLTILIWHLYHAHLRPDIFPANPVFLTGRVTEEQMIHHHPLEYEKVKNQPDKWITVELPADAAPQGGLEPGERPGRAASPIARVAGVVPFGAGGAAAGLAAPLVAYLPFVLVAWILNPSGNYWGLALMPVYLFLVPCTVVGAVSGVVDELRGRSFGTALYAALAAAMGFCLGPLLVWLPVVAISHVIGWLLPGLKVGEALANVGFVLTLALSLVVGTWAALWARRHGLRIGELLR